MADNFGLSFSPLGDRNGGQNDPREGGGAGASPIQDAIRVLSLRIPQFAGPGSIAPQQLLNSPGAAGIAPPGGLQPGGLEQFLKFLFGQMAGASGMQPTAPMPGGMPGAPGGAAPPKIGPGVQAPAPGGAFPEIPGPQGPQAPPQMPGTGNTPFNQEPIGQGNPNTFADRLNRGGITGNRFRG